jgi:hypothetical protein
MRFGRHSSISETAVQAVLDTLVFSTSHKTDGVSLQYLFVVEKQLLDPKIPHSEKQRLYTIQSTLIDMIISQLDRLRSRFGRDINTNEIYDDAIESLSSDSLIQSNELMGWSILYYLYVQVDLGLTIEGIANTIGVTPRTLRRYRTHGVELLTQKLWEEETLCRREYHYKSIQIQLEFANLVKFVGREDEMENAIHNIINKHCRVVYVHGDKGIGKTTFIKQTIAKLMDHILIDDLLWINDSNNAETILQHHFLPNNPGVSLKSIFSLFNCIIVLDNIDDLLKSADFEELLDALQGSIVFFSSRIHYSIVTPVVHVPLAKFDNYMTEEIIRYIFDDRVSDKTLDEIKSLSGGNPAEIHHIANYHKHSLPSSSYDNLIGGLKLEQRMFLLFVPFEDGLSVNNMKKICHILNISHSDISFLLNFGLINKSQQRIYSQLDPRIIANSLTKISDYIVKFINQIPLLDEPWIFATHILTIYHRYLDDHVIITLIDKFWRTALIYGNKVKWHSILLDMPKTNDLELSMAKAVSYKEMNELHLAETILLELVNLSGLKGEFSIQAEAILELVKICRLKNHYKQSIDYMDILNSSLKHHLESRQYNALIMEQAQLALDMNQIKYAIALVTSLNLPESLMIKAEALYRLDHHKSCIEICYSLLSEFQLSDTAKGIVHNLIGRCYQVIDHALATEQFDLAIEYFSKTFNLRHLSHAQINLATAFIYLEQLDKAIEMLNSAQEICQIMADQIGKRIIKKNKSYIHRLIISKY